jgi:hypothetical protein
MTRPPSRSKPAFVEIVERVPYEKLGDAIDSGIVRANEIRINGTPILCPKEEEVITVHEIQIGAGADYEDALVKVTLTMWARHVRIGHEHIETDG